MKLAVLPLRSASPCAWLPRQSPSSFESCAVLQRSAQYILCITANYMLSSCWRRQLDPVGAAKPPQGFRAKGAASSCGSGSSMQASDPTKRTLVPDELWGAFNAIASAFRPRSSVRARSVFATANADSLAQCVDRCRPVHTTRSAHLHTIHCHRHNGYGGCSCRHLRDFRIRVL